MKIEKLRNNKNSGITLIALVVTIVVLLVLAGITINVLFSENGVLTKAKEATEKTIKAELKQDVEMSKSEKDIDKSIGVDEGLENYLKKIQGVEIEDLAPDSWYLSRGNTGITVYEDGTILDGKVSIWDGQSSKVPEIAEFNWYIHTAEELKFLADFVNNENTLTETQKEMVAAKGYKEKDIVINETTTVFLMNNIDLGARHQDGTLISGTNWTPIGTSQDIYFAGTFEGNNNYIIGMFVKTESNYSGLFGAANVIQNLTIKDSYVESTNAVVGGIAGLLKSGTLKNCHNINTTVITDSYVGGGVVGSFYGEKVENCSNSGNVTCNGTVDEAMYNRLGGIVGVAMEAADFENCQNYGDIIGTGGAVAGIIGGTSGEGAISNCKNEGYIEGGYDGVGGIIGFANYKIIITNCNNIGEMSVAGAVGGIIGFAYYYSEVKNCFNTGNILTYFNGRRNHWQDGSIWLCYKLLQYWMYNWI